MAVLCWEHDVTLETVYPIVHTYSGATLRGTLLTIRLSFIQVICTGNEERLLDCYFPEAFGAAASDAGSNSTPENASDADMAPVRGVPESRCGRGDNRILGVMCRKFPINGAELVQ